MTLLTPAGNAQTYSLISSAARYWRSLASHPAISC